MKTETIKVSKDKKTQIIKNGDVYAVQYIINTVSGASTGTRVCQNLKDAEEKFAYFSGRTMTNGYELYTAANY